MTDLLPSHQQVAEIIRWHTSCGGSAGHPAAHALKLLEEVVELCFAAGATSKSIQEVVSSEITKAFAKGEEEQSHDRMNKEIADVYICLIVAAYYMQVNCYIQIGNKLIELNSRTDMVSSEDGSVRRKNRTPPAYNL